MATTEKKTPATTPARKNYVPKPFTYRTSVSLLAVGDFLCFMIFAAIGRRSHGEAAGLTALLSIFLTALPFIVAWFLVAPLVGAFKRDVVADPRKMALRTIIAWLIAWPIGLLFRGIFVDHAVPPLTFALIVLVFNAAILEVWRWPFALNNAMKQRKV
jgi:hypothetical protein